MKVYIMVTYWCLHYATSVLTHLTHVLEGVHHTLFVVLQVCGCMCVHTMCLCAHKQVCVCTHIYMHMCACDMGVYMCVCACDMGVYMGVCASTCSTRSRQTKGNKRGTSLT